MIIPDINLLVYSYDQNSPFHTTAKQWFEQLLNSGVEVGFPLVCLLGFVRLTSNPKIFTHPLTPVRAIEIVQTWLELSNSSVIEPRAKHFSLMSSLFSSSHATASLVTDCHIAALAIEHHATVYSNDVDFFRFPGLRVVNPLLEK